MPLNFSGQGLEISSPAALRGQQVPIPSTDRSQKRPADRQALFWCRFDAGFGSSEWSAVVQGQPNRFWTKNLVFLFTEGGTNLRCYRWWMCGSVTPTSLLREKQEEQHDEFFYFNKSKKWIIWKTGSYLSGLLTAGSAFHNLTLPDKPVRWGKHTHTPPEKHRIKDITLISSEEWVLVGPTPVGDWHHHVLKTPTHTPSLFW